MKFSKTLVIFNEFYGDNFFTHITATTIKLGAYQFRLQK